MAFGYLAVSSWLARLEVVKDSILLRQLLDVQTNATLFLALAYAIRRLPYMVRSAVAGLQQTSVTLEEAAANLGARSFTTLRRITLPLITANVIAGALLAFAFSMLEVSDSLMLAQRQDSYPDHQDDLRAVPAHRHRRLRGQRARRVGHGLPRRDHHRGQRDPRPQAGRAIPRLGLRSPSRSEYGSRHATVHGDGGSGDVTRELRSQEYDEIRDLIRLAGPAQRHTPQDVPLRLRRRDALRRAPLA